MMISEIYLTAKIPQIEREIAMILCLERIIIGRKPLHFGDPCDKLNKAMT
jgi:hypothetical protein